MNRAWFFVFIIFCIFLLAVRLFLFALYKPVLIDGQQILFATTVLSEPKVGSGYNAVNVSIDNVFGAQPIIIRYPQAMQLSYGQSLLVSGIITQKVIGKGVVYFLYFPNIQIQHEKQNIFLSLANAFRQRVKSIYESGLYSQHANLLLGIVFGVKGNFSKTFLSAFQSAGVMHVIAASGMNVTLLAGFILGLFQSFLRRQTAVILTVFVIGMYVLIAGMQASILRAGIMISFVFLAQLVGRQYSAFYALLVTVFLMILLNPSLVFDVGFQLSVFATLGILLIKPILPSHNMLDDFTTTLAAQIATLPILLANFGQIGILSVLINALVLWTIPPLMVLGGLAAIFGLFLKPLADLFLFFSAPLLWFFDSIVMFFGGLNLNVSVEEFPLMLMISYYCLLCSLVVFLTIRKQKIKSSIAGPLLQGD